MVERLIVTVVLIGVGLLSYRLVVNLVLRRAQAALPALAGREPGKYLIVYFTSPACAPCQTTQRPALRSVQETFGSALQVLTVDVTRQPDLAARLGVMTLPTTMLFDRSGHAGQCNLGVAPASTLAQQLIGMGAQPAPQLVLPEGHAETRSAPPGATTAQDAPQSYRR